MTLLSEKVQSKTFPEVKGVFGNAVGYQSEHVDLFLEEVSTEIETIEKERTTLKERLRALEEDRELRGGAAPLSEDTSEVKKRMEQLELLERSYKRIIYLAEEEAQKIRDEANEEARRVIGEAQNKAQALVKEANIRHEEKHKEIQNLLIKEEEIDQRLQYIADFIMNKKTAERAAE